MILPSPRRTYKYRSASWRRASASVLPGDEQRGDRRGQTGSLRAPGAVKQNGILAGVEHPDERAKLDPRHPHARRQGHINLRRPGRQRRGDLVAVPRIPRVRSPQVQDGLDLVLTKGSQKCAWGHLSRSVDPSRLQDREVVRRLIPADPRQGKRQNQRHQPCEPPAPSHAAKPHGQSPRRPVRGMEPAIAGPWQTPRSRTGRCDPRRNLAEPIGDLKSPAMPGLPCNPDAGSDRRHGPGWCDDVPRRNERKRAGRRGRPAGRRPAPSARALLASLAWERRPSGPQSPEPPLPDRETWDRRS